jgi:cation diffusion facilitator CzcD-associated flavoprotein CzcO
MTDMPESSSYDVVIVGAGISGINTAYHIQRNLPNLKYKILEGRSNIGGTWDLFRYPGIRSDTDLHTFGFGWNLWNENHAIADGASIANYLKQSAHKEGIYDRILFNRLVKTANWSSEDQTWKLRVETGLDTMDIQTQFLILGTGYYDYEEPLTPEIPGLSISFKKTVAHPQFWPDDLDYENKRVVIIGSGATAITLLPNLAKKAAHVTMLQRSPTYIMSISNATGNSWYHKLLPRSWSFRIERVIFMWTIVFMYNMCRLFPESSRKKLQAAMAKELPEHVSVDPNFTPRYRPWDQRVCFAPDGDFFKSLRTGKAHVETGNIQAVNACSITLESGKELEADIIVPATGLRLIIGGRIEVSVDNKPINLADRYAWRAAFLQDVPNLVFLVGYINASWTLGAETTGHLVCRILRHMESNNFGAAIPRLPVDSQMQSRPIWNLDATYVKKSQSSMPRCGDAGPWKGRTNYFVDLWKAKYGSLVHDMDFQKARKTKLV